MQRSIIGIEATESANGSTYFQTTRRGVGYVARIDVLGRWEVSSHREALGPRHVGTVRHFPTLSALCAAIPAYAGLDMLIA